MESVILVGVDGGVSSSGCNCMRVRWMALFFIHKFACLIDGGFYFIAGNWDHMVNYFTAI
jgi:hypothetical protein